MPSFVGKSGKTWSFDPDRRLGSPGGFGEVFVGSDGRAEYAIKRVALKLGDTRELRRRERELEIAQKLTGSSTPLSHVLVPIDWGTYGRDIVLVMAKAEHSLADAIADPRFSTDARYAAIRDVAAGLDELSAAGILHRDLKPANVLRLNGRWVLSDFGISRDVDQSTATNTFTGAGSLPYMAPEVWDLRPATMKSDLYALGVLAYETMTGRRPFRGPNAEDYERQHTQETPPTLDINDGRMSRLIIRLLSKDPASRPQDARSVVETVDSAMRRIDSSQEQLAAAAAAMAQALSQQEAERSKLDRVKESRSQALKDLGAFLADFSDDISDVFPKVELFEGEHFWYLGLEPSDIWITPMDFQPASRYASRSRGDFSTEIACCGVRATLPGTTENPRALDMAGGPAAYRLECVANLMCDKVDGRLEWTISTWRYASFFPKGTTNSDPFQHRAEASHGASVSSGLWRAVPLSTESMMTLLQHVFAGLSGSATSPFWPGVTSRRLSS